MADIFVHIFADFSAIVTAVYKGWQRRIFEFSLNVSKKIILKRLFEPVTSCMRDQDATTALSRHR